MVLAASRRYTRFRHSIALAIRIADFMREFAVGGYLEIALARVRLDGDLIQVPDRLLDQRLLGRDQITQRHVEEDGGDEAEHPVEGVQVRQTRVDVHCLGPADAEAEAGEQRRYRHDEGHRRAPVTSRDVPVTAVRVVQGGDVDVLLLHEPEIGCDDACQRTQEHGVPAQEREERLG